MKRNAPKSMESLGKSIAKLPSTESYLTFIENVDII